MDFFDYDRFLLITNATKVIEIIPGIYENGKLPNPFPPSDPFVGVLEELLLLLLLGCSERY